MSNQELVHKLLNHIDYGRFSRFNMNFMKPSLLEVSFSREPLPHYMLTKFGKKYKFRVKITDGDRWTLTGEIFIGPTIPAVFEETFLNDALVETFKLSPSKKEAVLTTAEKGKIYRLIDAQMQEWNMLTSGMREERFVTGGNALLLKAIGHKLRRGGEASRGWKYVANTTHKGSDENDTTEQRPSRTNAGQLGKKNIKGKLVTNYGYPIKTVEIEEGMLFVTDASDKTKRKIRRTIIKTQSEEYPVDIHKSLIYLMCDRDIVENCKFDTATHSMDLDEFVARFRQHPNKDMHFEFTPLKQPNRINVPESYSNR